ncbi:MAG: hypothetical protein QM767_28755 [Anaeromyxobacter sp.]
MAPRHDEDLDPEPTAQPSDHHARALQEEDDEKVVPVSNVGGAAPTPLGLDSGGDLAGPEDDLSNLSEPEPPEAPEVGALHVRDEEDELRAARTDDDVV